MYEDAGKGERTGLKSYGLIMHSAQFKEIMHIVHGNGSVAVILSRKIVLLNRE